MKNLVAPNEGKHMAARKNGRKPVARIEDFREVAREEIQRHAEEARKHAEDKAKKQMEESAAKRKAIVHNTLWFFIMLAITAIGSIIAIWVAVEMGWQGKT